MAQPYVGEIRMFAGNFAPAGWMFCEGSSCRSENETLFQLIGTTYGGDGESTFALPDLRGRIPIHQGNGFILAETGGAEEITLTVNQIPAHTPSRCWRHERSGERIRRRAIRCSRRPRPCDAYYRSDTARPSPWPAARSAPGRRQPAAHELPAVPVHRFHHFPVRDFPVPT